MPRGGVKKSPMWIYLVEQFLLPKPFVSRKGFVRVTVRKPKVQTNA